VLGDLWRAEERGTAAAYYSLGPLLGPAVGPIIGGWVAQKVPDDGYRWIFFSSTSKQTPRTASTHSPCVDATRSLAVFCALVQVVGVFFLQETYHPILLQRQAKAIKKERGLDVHSDHVKTVYEVKNGRKTVAHVVGHGLVRPFVMLGSEPILQILSLYM
jgi:MFS family permease